MQNFVYSIIKTHPLVDKLEYVCFVQSPFTTNWAMEHVSVLFVCKDPGSR